MELLEEKPMKDGDEWLSTMMRKNKMLGGFADIQVALLVLVHRSSHIAIVDTYYANKLLPINLGQLQCSHADHGSQECLLHRGL